MDAQEVNTLTNGTFENHWKHTNFIKNERPEVNFELPGLHVGSCWIILGACWCTLGQHNAMMDRHRIIMAHFGSPLGLWGEKVAVARVILTFSKTVIGDLWGSRAKSGCG